VIRYFILIALSISLYSSDLKTYWEWKTLNSKEIEKLLGDFSLKIYQKEHPYTKEFDIRTKQFIKKPNYEFMNMPTPKIEFTNKTSDVIRYDVDKGRTSYSFGRSYYTYKVSINHSDDFYTLKSASKVLKNSKYQIKQKFFVLDWGNGKIEKNPTFEIEIYDTENLKETNK
jgi:hypothetical protein